MSNGRDTSYLQTLLCLASREAIEVSLKTDTGVATSYCPKIPSFMVEIYYHGFPKSADVKSRQRNYGADERYTINLAADSAESRLEELITRLREIKESESVWTIIMMKD